MHNCISGSELLAAACYNEMDILSEMSTIGKRSGSVLPCGCFSKVVLCCDIIVFHKPRKMCCVHYIIMCPYEAHSSTKILG